MLKRKTITATGKGGFVTTWPEIATVWAKVVGLNGREALIDHVFEGISYFRFTIRYRVDLMDADQLRYGTLDLNIRSIIDPDDSRETLEIAADTSSALPTS